MTTDLVRRSAMPLLWDVLERAATDPATVLVWIMGRGEGEGGFLWLAGQLSCRPKVLEECILKIVHTSGRQHSGLRERLRWARKRYGYEA